MFRASANILLSFVFLITSMGFSINQHYCGNTLVKVSLMQVNNCCSHCNKCHNKVSHIKITDSFNAHSNNFSLINSFVFSTLHTPCSDFLLSIIAPDPSISADISPPTINLDNCFLQVFRN
jgi:hypothetical protein